MALFKEGKDDMPALRGEFLTTDDCVYMIYFFKEQVPSLVSFMHSFPETQLMDTSNFKVMLYEHKDEIRLFTVGDKIKCFKFNFDVSTLSASLELKTEIDYNWANHGGRFYRFSKNLLANIPAEEFYVFSTADEKLTKIRLPQNYRRPGCLCAYLETNKYVFIDGKMKKQISVDLNDTSKVEVVKLQRSLKLRFRKRRNLGMAFAAIYSHRVFIATKRGYFLEFDKVTKQLREVTTELSQATLICLSKIIYTFSQNSNGLYISGDSVPPSYYKATVWMMHPTKARLTAHHIIEELCLDEEKEPVHPTEEPTCPICYDVYLDPKILSNCGHTICGRCASMSIIYEGLSLKKNVVSCPICRARTVVKKDGDLPTNWALKGKTLSRFMWKIEDILDAVLFIDSREDPVVCPSCDAQVHDGQMFDCAKCAKKEKAHEKLICGSCAVNNHKNHIKQVRKTELVPQHKKETVINMLRTKKANLVEAEKMPVGAIHFYNSKLGLHLEKIDNAINRLENAKIATRIMVKRLLIGLERAENYMLQEKQRKMKEAKKRTNPVGVISKRPTSTLR
ncbi:hypothetical protein QR680_004321 [Steinernema hermaphroditum]|uniref:RING-type domain-containing protein n=1 Tax=Steinernema hermaphroditum TaxID=289476 RepID=A0AA39HPD1_9BILA|nr:hypothetical protein QR680_004321 [Steinernema hermaphroditum]